MSKVQDFIRSFTRKVKSSVALTEQLRVPAQTLHNGQLPIDPAGIKTWLLAQDINNNGNAGSAKTLLRALQHSNRTVNDASHRLMVMQQFEKPFTIAMQSLDCGYLYLDLPLHTDAEKSFHLGVTLCQEMAYGYKIAIKDSIACRTQVRLHADGQLDKAQTTLAISRALEYLSQMALRYSQVYRDWPDTLWRDINTLTAIAINDGITDTAIAGGNKTNNNQQSGFPLLTIRAQLARLSVLHIIDHKHLLADQLRTLFARITEHADELEFYESAQANVDNLYSVGGNNGPVLHQFRYLQPDTRLLYFSPDALLAKVDSMIDPMDQQNAALNMSQRLKRKRSESRASRSALITAETGLKEIYTLIRMAPPTDQIDAQFTDVSELLQLNSTQRFQETRKPSDTLNSINTSDFGNAFKVINESRDGFGLELQGKSSCRLQIGEIMAHCYREKNDVTSWHLSVVRWLRTGTDNTLSLGVETITRHANAVDVFRMIKGRHQSFTSAEGLLANYQPIDSKARMLILPVHQYKAGEMLSYRDNQGFHRVKLIESVHLEGNFQCFAISAVNAKLSQDGTSNVIDFPVAV